MSITNKERERFHLWTVPDPQCPHGFAYQILHVLNSAKAFQIYGLNTVPGKPTDRLSLNKKCQDELLSDSKYFVHSNCLGTDFGKKAAAWIEEGWQQAAAAAKAQAEAAAAAVVEEEEAKNLTKIFNAPVYANNKASNFGDNSNVNDGLTLAPPPQQPAAMTVPPQTGFAYSWTPGFAYPQQLLPTTTTPTQQPAAPTHPDFLNLFPQQTPTPQVYTPYPQWQPQQAPAMDEPFYFARFDASQQLEGNPPKKKTAVSGSPETQNILKLEDNSFDLLGLHPRKTTPLTETDDSSGKVNDEDPTAGTAATSRGDEKEGRLLAEAEVSELKEQMSDLEAGKEAEVSALKHQISHLETRKLAEVSELKERISDLETCLQDIAEVANCVGEDSTVVLARVRSYDYLAALVRNLVQSLQRNGTKENLTEVIKHLQAVDRWDPDQDDDTPSDPDNEEED